MIFKILFDFDMKTTRMKKKRIILLFAPIMPVNPFFITKIVSKNKYDNLKITEQIIRV